MRQDDCRLDSATRSTTYIAKAAAQEAPLASTVAFSKDGACTNQAESYVSRLRRASRLTWAAWRRWWL